MEFQDRSIQCIDCHQDFVFTAGEQEFYERKGFKELPKRCKPCREARKARRDGAAAAGGMSDMDGGRGGRGYGGGYGGGGGGGGGQREMFDAVCAACGSPARVPFRPAAGRPVYCRDCYSNRSTGY
jgi:CxxC-x17-CxxC domain-containing protein